MARMTLAASYSSPLAVLTRKRPSSFLTDFASARNQHRLGHHVLASLIGVDRIRQVVRSLQQRVRKPIALRVGSRREARGTGTDDDQIEGLHDVMGSSLNVGDTLKLFHAEA